MCFVEKDLYTTHFSSPNDDIERIFFGRIDYIGHKAVPGIISSNVDDTHRYWNDFMIYMDIQKLRTPKGLDWLETEKEWREQNRPEFFKKIELLTRRESKKTQDNTLITMQLIHRIHITMWTEAYWEIVSAEESETKFIVSDHPVTIFNPQTPPHSRYCLYPYDPNIDLIGSRTVFPLDLNHCLILTNKQYALDPKKDCLKARINARTFDTAIFKLDSIVRGRKLDKNEVRQINLVLKKRARRFIAAAEIEWLYPENHIPEHLKCWAEIDDTLLPDPNKLSYGSETIFFGDGWKIGVDEHGRTLNQNKYEEAKELIDRVKRTPPGSSRIAD